MNSIDILVSVVLLLNALLGAIHGFTYQAFRLGGLILAFVGSHRYGRPLGDAAASWIPMEGSARALLAYAALFVAIYGLVWLISHRFRRVLERARLVGADRSLGFLLGLFKGLVFVALGFQVVLVFVGILPQEVTRHLEGDPAAGIPPSRAFRAHQHFVVGQMEHLFPPEVRARLQQARAEGR